MPEWLQWAMLIAIMLLMFFPQDCSGVINRLRNEIEELNRLRDEIGWLRSRISDLDDRIDDIENNIDGSDGDEEDY